MDVLLVVQPDPDADAEDGEKLVRRLRSELANLDVDDVRTVAGGVVPEGAKSADPVTISAIVLAMSASGGLFASVVDTVGTGWPSTTGAVAKPAQGVDPA